MLTFEQDLIHFVRARKGEIPELRDLPDTDLDEMYCDTWGDGLYLEKHNIAINVKGLLLKMARDAVGCPAPDLVEPKTDHLMWIKK